MTDTTHKPTPAEPVAPSIQKYFARSGALLYFMPGAICNCTAPCTPVVKLQDVADMVERGAALETVGTQRDSLLAALTLLYDKWENGTPCYEDPEDYTGPLGNAFKLTDEEETLVLQAFEAAGVRTVLTFARAADRATLETKRVES